LYHRAVLAARQEGKFLVSKHADVYYPAYNEYIGDFITDKKIADAQKTARSAHAGSRPPSTGNKTSHHSQKRGSPSSSGSAAAAPPAYTAGS
jgi:hypothetical protein